jgi:hypothetical protein
MTLSETIEDIEVALNEAPICEYPDFTDTIREVLALARQAEALQRENAELRKALKPLAAEADCWSSAYPDTCLVARTSKISLGTIRRARALLGGENAE